MNKTEKFLIVGATGLIGRSIIEELNGSHQWMGTYFSKKRSGLIPLDVNDKRRIGDIFSKEAPTHVVYCANLSGGVDFCEKNPDLARKLHFEGAVNIAGECLKHKAKLIFISSECVFDGKKESYDENDEVNPLNVYGKCKV
ncbi:MAG: sugar nucleotide-binding protein, partial [Candidatus Omnitrophica bacterium]|nr:sugar nucleotide-binding protein [Candidatus Omnitrophota bacterium]